VHNDSEYNFTSGTAVYHANNTTNYIQYNPHFVSKYINISTNKICVTDARLAVLHGQGH